MSLFQFLQYLGAVKCQALLGAKTLAAVWRIETHAQYKCIEALVLRKVALEVVFTESPHLLPTTIRYHKVKTGLSGQGRLMLSRYGDFARQYCKEGICAQAANLTISAVRASAR